MTSCLLHTLSMYSTLPMWAAHLVRHVSCRQQLHMCVRVVCCRCGQGKVGRGDGYQYSGQWLDDQPHGHGTAFHSATSPKSQ